MRFHPRFAWPGKAAFLVVVPMLAAITPVPWSRGDALPQAANAAPARPGKNKKAPKDFHYSVSDCLGSDKKDSVGLEVSEGAVSFNQTLSMNCIAATHPSTVKVTYSKKGRELQVVVTLASEVLSQCTCPIGIEGWISDLGKGAYRISFVYDFKPGNSTNEKPTRQALGAKEFSIE